MQPVPEAKRVRVYREEDYPGIFKRILIDAVDWCALLVLLVLLTLLADPYREPQAFVWCILAYLGFSFIYLGPWKATGRPTLGYLLFGVRLVNDRGERVDFWQASVHGLFLLFAAVHWIYLFDLLWVHEQSPRRSLREKFSGTWLVRKSAVSVGEGRLAAREYYLLGYRMRAQEIEMPA